MKDDEELTGEDAREGLIAVISVKLEEPQFEGQTKQKLGNSEARTAVDNIVSTQLEIFLEQNPSVGKMTVGQELTKITDLRLFHNHMTIEPVIEIFGALTKPVALMIRLFANMMGGHMIVIVSLIGNLQLIRLSAIKHILLLFK